MQNQNEEKNFMDPRTLAAIILVGVVWFGWQSYLTKKYPPPPPQTQEQLIDLAEEGSHERNEPVMGQLPVEQEEVIAADFPEEIFSFESAEFSFSLSSRGMGIFDVVLHDYTDRDGENIRLVSDSGNPGFSSHLLNALEPLDFEVSQVAANVFEGQALFGETKIIKRLEIDSSSYSIESSIRVEDAPPEFPGLMVMMTGQKVELERGSFFVPNFEYQDFSISSEAGSDRINISGSNERIERAFREVDMVSLGTQYFTVAFADNSVRHPDLLIEIPAAKLGTTRSHLQYARNYLSRDFEISYTAYAGPKALHILKAVDSRFEQLVNFGIVGVVARPLLSLLRIFYSWVNNWGFAIILLTLVVRILVLPFAIMSFKSMKAMQKIQPLMKEVREKYKDDPQTQQKEVMQLMRDHKVNPLGGCLPLLLQLPIFFALFRVFSQSVELYQAPFIFWVEDLSMKDPYFVLPILLGVFMYLQMKLTPTTMDPTQAKVMKILPPFFTLIMMALPAGLNLYSLVSTVFGVVQQYILMRDFNPPVKEASGEKDNKEK